MWRPDRFATSANKLDISETVVWEKIMRKLLPLTEVVVGGNEHILGHHVTGCITTLVILKVTRKRKGMSSVHVVDDSEIEYKYFSDMELAV